MQMQGILERLACIEQNQQELLKKITTHDKMLQITYEMSLQIKKKYQKYSQQSHKEISHFKKKMKSFQQNLQNIHTDMTIDFGDEQANRKRSQTSMQKNNKKSMVQVDASESQEPLEFMRKSNELSQIQMLKTAQKQFQEHLQQKLKNDQKDITEIQSTLLQILQTIKTNVPSTHYTFNPKHSKNISRYKSHTIQTQYNTILQLQKKSQDKKYQLIGEQYPQTGRYYFKIKLLEITNGYVHIGIISDKRQKQTTSYDSKECINYFGGNGSLNDRGNGVFKGIQFVNGDVVVIVVDMDQLWVKFVVKNKVISSATILSQEKWHPYIQLFYGNSKFHIINP